MDLSIIFVNWNSLEYLRECLVSIHHNVHSISFEVIVVDNASTQLGIDRIAEEFPGTTVIKSDSNLGFAGANNLGFEKCSGDAVLFLNPDTKLLEPSINTLLNAVRSLPRAGIVGCKILNTDLTIQTSCIQTFPTIVNQVLDFEYLRLRWPSCSLWGIGPLFSEAAGPQSVEVISGACMMMSRNTFVHAGMFSKDYFMYAEDLDLCYKVRKLGLINYFIGETTIIHHGGKSTGQNKVNQWATTMKFRAVQKFCVKTRGPIYGAAYRLSMGFAAIGRLMMLGIASCVGGNKLDRNGFDGPSEKWRAVARWAFGRRTSSLRSASS